jgi:hypothetical protein
MPKFKVKSPLHHNGKPYAIGSTVELDADEAALVAEAVESISDKQAKQDAADRDRIKAELKAEADAEAAAKKA